MKKFLLAMTAIGALATAAPSVAQYSQTHVGGALGISNRIAQLDTRLEASIRTGAVSRSEAIALRRELRDLRRLERHYSRNGLTVQERTELQARIRDFREDLRVAGGASVRYDRYGNPIDDDDYYGRGGPDDIQEREDCDRSDRRGGLGGLLGGILGGRDDDDNCGLRVGARASGNLGAVPYEYRRQFRDGNGILYRSDGRSIYQIDARTHTVLRVYSINR